MSQNNGENKRLEVKESKNEDIKEIEENQLENNSHQGAFDLTLKSDKTEHKIIENGSDTELEDEATNEQKRLKLTKTPFGWRRLIVPTVNNQGTYTETEIDKMHETLPSPEFNERKSAYQDRAINLLKTGVMPLCPPGRRNWDSSGTFETEINGKQFSWPPKGFTLMSPDRKLLAWEQAALFLENETAGILPNNVSRSYLLDKYNFLALPGTAKYQKEESETAVTRARFYTYQMVREIGSGRVPSKAEEDQIQTLESVKKAQSKPFFDLEKIEIPLRLVIN
jgi:hypothetical protein